DHCPQISWRVVAKFYYATWLAFEDYDHASSDLGCWNCHYLFDFLMIWARSDWQTRGTCKGRSLAARTRHCPANRLHKTERASPRLRSAKIIHAACSLSGGAHLPVSINVAPPREFQFIAHQPSCPLGLHNLNMLY